MICYALRSYNSIRMAKDFPIELRFTIKSIIITFPLVGLCRAHELFNCRQIAATHFQVKFWNFQRVCVYVYNVYFKMNFIRNSVHNIYVIKCRMHLFQFRTSWLELIYFILCISLLRSFFVFLALVLCFVHFFCIRYMLIRHWISIN